MWLNVLAESGDAHVFPLGDTQPHAESRYCGCAPDYQDVNGSPVSLTSPDAVVVIHKTAHDQPGSAESRALHERTLAKMAALVPAKETR